MQQAQGGAEAFARIFATLTADLHINPFTDFDTAATWSAVILARILLMPSQEDMLLLGAMRHDMNLGTQAIAPFVDGNAINAIEAAGGLGAMFTAKDQPTWLAGTLAQRPPVHSLLYTLFAAGIVPSTAFAERKTGSLDVTLISAVEARTATVPVYESIFGRLRIHIPTVATMRLTTIVVPSDASRSAAGSSRRSLG